MVADLTVFLDACDDTSAFPERYEAASIPIVAWSAARFQAGAALQYTSRFWRLRADGPVSVEWLRLHEGRLPGTAISTVSVRSNLPNASGAPLADVAGLAGRAQSLSTVSGEGFPR